MHESHRDFVFIDQPNTLENFCRILKNNQWIALDTEFIRERTYYPKLCLVQIAGPSGEVACIDTSAIDALSPLIRILLDPAICKVLHAGSQDMEIFCTLCGQSPVNVFDTQIAAPLFGYQEQMGYAALVEQRLGVSLAKTQSRTDWAARPLSDKQLRYAADDVIYLAQLFPAMHQALEDKQRFGWLSDEFKALCDINTYQKSPDEVWQRVRGVEKLSGHALGIVQALAMWRETTARERDMPKNWLLKDDTIIDIARLKPTTEKELQSLRGLTKSVGEKQVQTILALCQKAAGCEPQPLPVRFIKRKLNAREDALVDLLSAVAKLYADQHAINHAVLAPRKELEKLVTGSGDSRILSGWRKQFVGRPLQQLLDGSLALSVAADGQITLIEKASV